MELILKVAGTALITAVIGLLIKRQNPEIAISLSLCVIAVIFAAAFGFCGSLCEFMNAVKNIAGTDNMMIIPVFKCLAIAIVTKLSSELCKDASQAATASAVEFAGAVCALSVAMPMMVSMLKMVGSMV